MPDAPSTPAPGTRQRLIDTAQALFYEHGFHAIGLDRILAEVGVTKTTFYNHFESKDELIIAVLKRHDERDRATLVEQISAVPESEPRARLLALFDVLEGWFQEPDFRGCLFINAASAYPSANDPIHKVAASHFDQLRAYVRGLSVAAGADRPDELARKFMVLVTGAVVERHTALNPEAARTARSAAEMLLERYLPAPTGA
jgi:AcrR family transcriptional regulator